MKPYFNSVKDNKLTAEAMNKSGEILGIVPKGKRPWKSNKESGDKNGN